jgi:hypothetical protein
MIDLKFFYIVELNLQHPSIAKLTLSKEFKGQSWLTLTSACYENDKDCVDNLKQFMKVKTEEFNKGKQHVTCSYAENPYLHCAPEDIETLETDFDENALVSMSITDFKDDWLIQAAVMVFGSEEEILYRRLH